MYEVVMTSPRCFRGLNKIANVKDREAELISRLHECGRSWAGEYPSPEEVVLVFAGDG